MDPKRATRLAVGGGLVTIVGVALGIAGLVLFGSAFLTPSRVFFADPKTTMDHVARNGFFGVVLFGTAGGLVPIGLVLLAVGLTLRGAGRGVGQARGAT